ncbi:hypothetical protein CYY_009223 [Polysphondylium violaceum]|uniref:PPM-type phosphatase domain-containing protein n=1 Tax=Polysphondylium violaceum TaxID=133409 RepID=A0A8J4PLV8_9MYCE|nr:hypothetical protein CYY_009223 [Polysphondylium violaceum]
MSMIQQQQSTNINPQQQQQQQQQQQLLNSVRYPTSPPKAGQFQQQIQADSPSLIHLKLPIYKEIQLKEQIEQKQQQEEESYVILNSQEGKPLVILKLKQVGPNLFNFEIDSNENSEVTIQNHTKKYYFKGLINSIGKQPNLCEDSHFLSQDYTAIGVADGVGSWRSIGIDSGQYSRFLMNNIYHLSTSIPYLKPFDLIQKTYESSLSIPGSSTICILKLLGSKVYSGLIGDSSFLIIRKDQIIFRSKEQTHKPNFPFQLGQGSTDKPSSGSYDEHIVNENDIFVIGTDGFFDNVFDEEILESMKRVESIETFHKHLMNLAKQKSIDINATTPIANRNSTKGGKPDDITLGCFVITPWSK